MSGNGLLGVLMSCRALCLETVCQQIGWYDREMFVLFNNMQKLEDCVSYCIRLQIGGSTVQVETTYTLLNDIKARIIGLKTLNS